MRRPLTTLLALLLGVGAALLVACGDGTSGGVPAANASDLKSQINDVRQAVDDGRCTDVPGQLKQVDEGVDDLPPSTDTQLVRGLRDGADTLRRVAVNECNARDEDTTTTETTTTETTTTETVPEETTPDETVPQETTPIPTTPTPTTTIPTPPPVPEPPPPPPPPP
ncbi:MAG: hypothetical protein ACRDLN_17610, partial [Solirubrobacteraceae bacterium]